MLKSLAIPAAEWVAANTDEQKEALRHKYTVHMTQTEIAAIEEQQRIDAENVVIAAQKEAKAAIYKALDEIDMKSIRALREGNQERLAALEAEAEELRKALK